MIAVHLLRQHFHPSGTRQHATGFDCWSGARLEHVRDLIESALGEDRSFERLAGEAGIGTHAFSAAFTRAFGVSPHRYVVGRRLERAKRMLRASEVTWRRSRRGPASPARATWPPCSNAGWR